MKDIFKMTKQELEDYIAGGEFDECFTHVKAKHVNKSDPFLKSRILYQEKGCSSTFIGDERRISIFLRISLLCNIGKIHTWLASGRREFLLALDIPKEIGTKKFVAYPSGIREEACSEALIILEKKRCAYGPSGWRVKLTAFPQ